MTSAAASSRVRTSRPEAAVKRCEERVRARVRVRVRVGLALRARVRVRR